MVWGALLVVAGIVLAPRIGDAWWRIELLGDEPPRELPVPVRGVEPEDLRDTWGDPRAGGARRHEGIDIFAARRRPVLSTTRGIVVRRGENPLGGRVVTILGPGGWRHYYAHLEQWGGHSRGDRVRAGEVIGFVGTSGNAPPQAPHLHYAIYTSEGAINPYPLLVRDSAPAGGPTGPGAPAP